MRKKRFQKADRVPILMHQHNWVKILKLLVLYLLTFVFFLKTFWHFCTKCLLFFLKGDCMTHSVT